MLPEFFTPRRCGFETSGPTYQRPVAKSCRDCYLRRPLLQSQCFVFPAAEISRGSSARLQSGGISALPLRQTLSRRLAGCIPVRV